MCSLHSYSVKVPDEKREAWYCFQPLFYLHYCGDLFKFLYLHAYITFIVTTYIDIIYVRFIYRKAKTVG